MCLEIRLEREEESPISNISARLRQCVTQTASRAALAEFAGPYPGIQDSNRPEVHQGSIHRQTSNSR